jgi:hypothetical protein
LIVLATYHVILARYHIGYIALRFLGSPTTLGIVALNPCPVPDVDAARDKDGVPLILKIKVGWRSGNQ